MKDRTVIVAVQSEKWRRGQGYRLIEALLAFRDERIAARYADKFHDEAGQCHRATGNENRELDDAGLEV